MAKSKFPNRSKRYPPEFHQQLVELHRAGRRISQLSREFGVSVVHYPLGEASRSRRRPR
jgi:transposase-like protein